MQQSATDYICFSMQMCMAAILLETKAEYSQNALAQVIGYYIKARFSIWKPAVCCVTTPSTLQVVLFPFMKDKVPLVNACELQK